MLKKDLFQINYNAVGCIYIGAEDFTEAMKIFEIYWEHKHGMRDYTIKSINFVSKELILNGK